MSIYDEYYRLLKDFKQAIAEYRETKEIRDEFLKSDSYDRIEFITYDCEIKLDWINEIESNLKYIEKSIEENRQFISNHGEVVPIEKVKHVSKASIEHLAKHSNLISKEENENGDIIPDKLFVEEKDTDYAIYENRFLYMLLTYLKDFINVRLERIVDSQTTFNSNVVFKNDISYNRNSQEFSLTFKEEKKDFLESDKVNRNPNIRRIENIFHQVSSLMNTPLMQEAAKEPLLKAPITRTNILKMDTNFSKAYDLFEYLNAYTDDGYEILENKNEIFPFNEIQKYDFADLSTFISFLVYYHGSNNKELFEINYAKEEERRKEAQKQIDLEKLNTLKFKLASSKDDIENYLVILEDRNALLEKENKEVVSLRSKIVELQQINKNLSDNNEALTVNVDYLRDSVSKKEASIVETFIKHHAEIKEIKEACESEIATNNSNNQAKINKLEEDYRQQLLEKDKLIFKLEHPEASEEIGKIYLTKSEGDEIRKENEFLKARISALMEMACLDDSKDYTLEENFNELEIEYTLLKEKLESNWKLAKKKIREDVKKKMK